MFNLKISSFSLLFLLYIEWYLVNYFLNLMVNEKFSFVYEIHSTVFELIFFIPCTNVYLGGAYKIIYLCHLLTVHNVSPVCFNLVGVQMWRHWPFDNYFIQETLNKIPNTGLLYCWKSGIMAGSIELEDTFIYIKCV